MGGQDFFEIGFGDTHDGAFAVGIGIVRAPVAVQDGDFAKPDARFDIGEGDLLARNRGRADPYRAFGAGNPFLGWIATGTNQFAVFVTFDVSASKNVVSE